MVPKSILPPTIGVGDVGILGVGPRELVGIGEQQVHGFRDRPLEGLEADTVQTWVTCAVTVPRTRKAEGGPLVSKSPTRSRMAGNLEVGGQGRAFLRARRRR